MSLNHSKYLLVGATGQQGGAVIHGLLSKGHHVRTLVRSGKQNSEISMALKSLGVKMVIGDMTD